MNALLKIKTSLSGDNPSRSAWYRYGFLALILGLFAFVLYHPGEHCLRGLIVPVMLLLNHLAYQFRWPSRLAFAFRVIALAWVVGGCIYLFIH